LRALWPEIIDVVKAASRRTRALLDNAQITSVEGETVSLAAPGALAKMIAEESNVDVLRSALTKVVGGSWRIAVGNGAVATAAEPVTPAAEPEADPRDDSEPADGSVRAASDPEADAIKLLQSELGARRLDS
jgi:DNA polymerase-3 subunit gamma/tau